MPSFAVSISVLALVQGALVALPRAGAFPLLARLRGPAWALVPAGSIVVVIFGLRAAAGAAQGITYLALIAVPPLAAAALGWVARGARLALGLLVVPLFALAWAGQGGLPGEAAATALSALSCVTLGAMLAAVAPPAWLKVGILAMACVDTALVVSDLLQTPNDALNAAAPALSLPRLQDVTFGAALMGYGDLFVAGVLGGLLAPQRGLALRGALFTTVIALAFNLLFLTVRELPATVPVALALLALECDTRRRARALRRRGAPAAPPILSDSRPAEYFAAAHAWARTHRPDAAFDLLRLLALPLCMVAYRARCIDTRHVPGSGPAIIAPNHFSAMDHFLAGIYLRRRVRFIAKSQLFAPPLAGIITHAGAFPVRRGQHDEEAMRTAQEILAGGGVVVIYPQGGRSRRSDLVGRARPGVGRLALQSGAPVVPVAIQGSERVRNWRRGQLPRITIQYGEPLRFTATAAHSRDDEQAVADEVFTQIVSLHRGLVEHGRRDATRLARRIAATSRFPR